MALTDIGVVAFVIKVDAQDVDAVFHAFRRVELHHVLVAQVIARGQNDALRGDLEVAVGAGGLGVDARDGALVIQDQLDALGGVAHLGAGVHGGLQVVGHDGGQAGKADGSGIAGQVLFGVVVGLRHRVHVGEHIVGLGVRRNLGVAFGRHVQVLAGTDEPVERSAGLVVVTADDALAHMVAALLHVHVHVHLLIEEAVAAAPLGLGLAAEDGHVAGHAVEVRGRLQAHHLRAGLGRGTGRRHAGRAQAHHDHVGRQLFFHLIVADCGRLAEPGQRARAVEADGGIGCARGAKRLARAARTAGESGPRDGGADERGSGEEVAASDVHFRHENLPFSRGALPLPRGVPGGSGGVSSSAPWPTCWGYHGPCGGGAHQPPGSNRG